MRRLAFALLPLALLLACSGSSTLPDGGPDAGPIIPDGGPIAVQMNDVSILYPLELDGGAQSIELISASASGARGTLLPSSLYDSIGHISGSSFPHGINPGGVGEAAYADLYVVAARLDPCFAALAPDPHGAGCLNQLRLIVQEVKLESGHLQVFDSAMHVFYSLTRTELESLALGLVGLRESSAGPARLGGLAPHPLLASEGLHGAYANGLRALILQYAGVENVTRVTQMSSNNNFRWAFQGFDLANPATQLSATIMTIPAVSAGTTQQAFQRSFGPNANMDGSFLPETDSTDDLALLANATNAAQATAAQRQGAFDSLVRVENPALFSANTIDCGSCHLALPAEAFNAAPDYGFTEAGNANAYVADGRFVLANELKAALDPNGPFNLHAFSYVGGSAAINQRVVNETAQVVTYLNTLQ